MFYSDARKKAIAKAKKAEEARNSMAELAQKKAIELYTERKQAAQDIIRVESYINTLANTPKEFKKQIAEVVANLGVFQEAVKMEQAAAADNLKAAGMAAGGAGLGVATAAMAPTAALAVATTFGTASTGAAIASLSGAAATNAALAWLGGGAIAAGGGGMAAGNALLALAGPLGWGIAAVGAIGGGAYACSKNKAAAQKANKYAVKMETERSKIKVYVAKISQIYSSTTQMRQLISVTPFNLYPNDYLLFSEEQKKALAALINNTKSLGALINEHIKP